MTSKLLARKSARASLSVALLATIGLAGFAAGPAGATPEPEASPSATPAAVPSPSPSPSATPEPADPTAPESVSPTAASSLPVVDTVARSARVSKDWDGIGVVSDGNTVKVRGDVRGVSEGGGIVVHLDGGGFLPLTTTSAAALVGGRHELTLAVPSALAASVEDAQSAAPSDARLAESGAPGLADPRFEALADAAQSGAYSVTAAAPLDAASLATASAPLDTGRPQVVTAEHATYIVPITLDYGNATRHKEYWAPSQGETNTTAALAASSDYWGSASGDKITFAKEDYVTYDESYSDSAEICDASNFADIATFGEGIAATESDYVAAADTHLVMVLPFDHDCGGTLGQAMLGSTVNDGGVLWVIGSEADLEVATWKHELGHNMSFGHSNTIKFWKGRPSLWYNEGPWEIYDYANVYDVMGYGLPDVTGGSFSAASSIDAGLWDEDEYFVGVSGSNDYVIEVVSSGEGQRGIAVKDPLSDDDRFYIEARSFTGLDAQVEPWKTVLPGPSLGEGVFILQMFNIEDEGEEIWGYQTYALPRPSDRNKVYFRKGHEFTSTTGGVKLKVLAANDDYAKVRVIVDGDVDPGDVSVSGSRIYGQELSVNLGTWTSPWGSSFAYEYQWLRNGANIDGATDATYETDASDVGKNIAVRVVGTIAGHEGEPGGDTSSAVAITKVPLDPEPITIDGVLRVGQTLTAATADWEPTVAVPEAPAVDYAYQWYRGTDKISGAKSSTYELRKGDIGKKLRVKVTASGEVVKTISAKSPYTAKVTKGIIAGELAASVDRDADTKTLTAQYDGVSEPGVAYKYKWYRNGKSIKKATKSTFKYGSKDRGKTLAVRITASKPGYVSQVDYSDPLHYSLTPDPAKPQIAGDLAVGETIGVGPIAYWVDDVSVDVDSTSYQWYRGTDKIKGATSADYTIVAKDRGKRLSVKLVTGAYGWVSSISKSDKTQRIRNNAIEGDLGVVVAASLVPMPELEAVYDGITEEGVTYGFQWYRNGNKIKGEKSKFYQTKAKDWLKDLKVRVTVTKSDYTTEVLTTADESWSLVPDGSPTLNITKPRVGDELTVTAPNYDPSGATLSYQWYRNGKVIAGADTDTYTAVPGDKGDRLKVKVWAEKDGYITAVQTAKTKDDVRKALVP